MNDHLRDLFCLGAAIDLKNDGGSLQKGPYSGKADVTFTVADQDFMEVVQGKLNPQKVRKHPQEAPRGRADSRSDIFSSVRSGLVGRTDRRQQGDVWKALS